MNVFPDSGPDGAAEPSRYRPFAHLAAPNAQLYRQVMGAFVTAKLQFSVHLRPEDVHEALSPGERPDPDAVAEALLALERWGNLRADPDTSRVTAVEDFYRRRYIYQLTQAGEAAEQALTAFDEALGRRGELQAVALADIATQLRALLALDSQGRQDRAVAHLTLLALVDRFSGLADNARAFMSSLQRTIDLHDVEVEAFLAYKDRLLDYLNRFIEDLITRGAEIARLLEQLGVPETGRAVLPAGPGGVAGSPAERLLRLAAAREAEDAAPDRADDAREDSYRRWCARWDGLRAWFLSNGSRASQAKLLRAAGRHAIPQLLAVVRVLNERRSGRSDRSADFRALALWFAQAPDDAARHRLWRGAFGLYPSRHLTVDQDSLAQEQESPVSSGTSWYDAPGVRISPQLRRTGSYERRGRARAVEDRTQARQYLAELARKQTEETVAARRRLVARGQTRLSDLGELDPLAFALFLQLLGDALAAWPPGADRVTATTNDGSMEIRMSRLPGAATAEVRTPNGVFRGPDHSLEIVDRLAEAEEPSPAEFGAGVRVAGEGAAT